MIYILLVIASISWAESPGIPETKSPGISANSTQYNSIRLDTLDLFKRQFQNGRPTITGIPTFQKGANFGQAPNISTFSSSGQLTMPNSTLFSTGSITAKDINSWGTIYQNGVPVSTNPVSVWSISGANIYNNNSGNVGIGISNPGSPLNIVGNSAYGQIKLSTGATTPANQAGIGVEASANQLLTPSTAGDLSIYTGNGNGLNLGTYATGTVLKIASGGNVGIGTTNPLTPLQINGANSSPSLSASNGVMSYRTNTDHTQIEFGGYLNSPYQLWMQGKDSDNDNTSFPIWINPLGGDLYVGTSTTPVTGAWTSWTPTSPTGCSGALTVASATKYKIIGSTLFYRIDVSCTSNSTSWTLTLPFALATNSTKLGSCDVEDNGSFLTTPGTVYQSSGALIALGKDSDASNLSKWTNSGTKRVFCIGEVELN